MTMKKNVLALAVSGGLIAAPMAAMAAPEVYGLIDLGVESYTDSDNAGTDIFQGLNSVAGNSDDRDFSLTNGMQSRLGVRGSEEINSDLTASYNLEFAVDLLNEKGGGFADSLGTRLGWAALGGDWGTVKVGSQWQALFEFGAWNTHRTDVHGYGSYYYTSGQLSNSLAYGFRQDSAISYQYGSAWGHSDDFAFNVTLGVGEGSTEVGEVTDTVSTPSSGPAEVVVQEGTAQQNREGISSIQVAGQYSFDKRISVNAVYVKEFNDYAAGGALNNEPSLMNLGGRWSVTDALELGINYTEVDLDNGNDDKRDSMAIASFMDFGNGLSGHLGFANGSDDRTGVQEIDLNSYGFIKQALSDRTSVRLELENIQYDDANDSSATVALVGLQHSF